MAEQAQKEPTMEEILSSIRKIIADEDQPAEQAVKPQTQPEVAVNDADGDVFGDLDLVEEEDFVDSVPETTDDVLAAINESMNEASEVLETEDAFEAVPEDTNAFESDFDDLLDLDKFEDPTPIEQAVPEVAFADEVEPSYTETTFGTHQEIESDLDPIETVAAKPEPTMTQAAPLADSRTASAAAGSLGKLLSKVEFGAEGGADNTIEGVVKDLLRPMLKEWLDENLPGIVEKHVEAEVQRIARMAR
jgi:hypothetical protein